MNMNNPLKDNFFVHLDSKIKKLLAIATGGWIVILLITVQPWRIQW